MCSSVIFSKKKIENLNEYVQENIDSRLYLFAYYNPKNKSNRFSELDFWKGITNVYGLFQDCAAFLKREFLFWAKRTFAADAGIVVSSRMPMNAVISQQTIAWTCFFQAKRHRGLQHSVNSKNRLSAMTLLWMRAVRYGIR